jgi:hypothetical protein
VALEEGVREKMIMMWNLSMRRLTISRTTLAMLAVLLNENGKPVSFAETENKTKYPETKLRSAAEAIRDQCGMWMRNFEDNHREEIEGMEMDPKNKRRRSNYRFSRRQLLSAFGGGLYELQGNPEKDDDVALVNHHI